jgi:hypothetical protein
MKEASRLYTKKIHGDQGGWTDQALNPLDRLNRR